MPLTPLLLIRKKGNSGNKVTVLVTQETEMKNDGKEEKKKFWNKTLIVVVILGIIVGYLSYLQDKKMNKMLEELDRKKMEQIDPSEIQNL